MNNTRKLVFGAFMACLSTLFQIIPALFSELFVLLTIFSAVPVYLIASISPQHGILAYIAAAGLISLFTFHEAIFFIFVNGIIGLVFGITRFYKKDRKASILTASISLSASLCIVNFIIGIPVIGFNFSNNIPLGVIALIVISVISSIIYYFMLSFLEKKIFPKGLIKRESRETRDTSQ